MESPFEENYGRKISYDPLWKGPVAAENRESTDLKFVIIFTIFYIFFWFLISAYALSSTRQENLEVIQTIATYIPITLTCLTLTTIISLTLINLLQSWPQITVWILLLYPCFILFYKTFKSIHTIVETLKKTDDRNSSNDTVVYASSFFILALLLMLLEKKINTAIAVIKEGSKASRYFSLLYVVALLESTCSLLLILVFFIVAQALFYINHSFFNGFQYCLWCFQLYNLFGLLWLMNFLSATAQIIISKKTATWYWTWDKDFIPKNSVSDSLKIVLRYHLGTAAKGSMFIVLFRIIRLIADLVIIVLEMKSIYFGTPWNECCCCGCRWLQFFSKYFNKRAYIMCAIHGTDYFSSSRNAFNLIKRNTPFAFLTDWAMIGILLYCQLIAVIAPALILSPLIYLVYHSVLTNGIKLFHVISIMIFHTIIISSPFFAVLRTAIDTVYLCALEDFERNDGSSSRPYFMSEKMRALMSI